MSTYSDSSFGLPYEDGTSRMVKSDTNGVRIVEPNPFGETVPHEDMFIFLSLTANQKNKTLLTQEDTGTYRWDHRPANSIDLMSPQELKSGEVIKGDAIFGSKPNLTTDWTEIGGHSVKKLGNDFEGFGITNVDIEIKSQTSPKVVIDFVDIRGATLFEQGSCSPYGLFFNLPYPIFELTAKGFYGKPVKYYLNLVKFNTKFNSETGNMECRAEFIGYSFAFLSDTIVGYVAASQYLKKETYKPQEVLQKKYQSTFQFYRDNKLPNFVGDGVKNPWCGNPVLGGDEGRCFTINDLLFRIKEFDTVSKPQIASSPEFNRLNNLTSLRNAYVSYRDTVYDFMRKLQESSGVQPVNTKAYDNDDPTKVTPSNVLSRFEIPPNTLDSLLKEGGIINTYFNKKSGLLPINIKIVKTTKISDNEYAGSNLVTMLTPASPSDLEGVEGDQCPGCSKMYEDLQKEAWQNAMVNTTIENLVYKTGSIIPPDNTTPRYIDMGYILKNIDYELNKLTGDDGVITKLKKEVVSSINTIVEQVIGFKPTIRNIFTVILCNTDAFMEILLKVAEDAEKFHEGIDYTNTPPFNESTYNGKKPKLFAWPTYFKRQFKPKTNGSSEVGSGGDQGTKEAFPGENTNFINWVEVRFVEDFIDAFLEYQRDVSVLNDEKEGKPGYDNYVPINPLESPLWNDNNPNKYLGLSNPQDIYTVIGERLFIALDHTYFSPIRITPDADAIPFIGEQSWNGLKNTGDNIATVIANIDAWNLLNSKEGDSAPNELAALMSGSKEKFISDVISSLKDKYPNQLLGTDANGADGTIKASDIKRSGVLNFNADSIGFSDSDNYIVFKPTDGIRLNPTTSRIPIMIKPNPFDMGIENLFKIIEGKDGESSREIKILPEDGDFSKAVDNYSGELTRRTDSIKFGNTEFGSNGGNDVTIEIDKKQKIVGYYDPRLFTTLAMADAKADTLSNWWNNKDLSSLSQSNMGLLSYWDDQGDNQVLGISLFNPDDITPGSGIVKETTKLNLGGSDSVDLADDVNGDGVSSPFITSPLWLDNINTFRGTDLVTPTQPFIVNHQGTTKSVSYDKNDIQNRNLAYLFLHTTKSTPLISRYVTDNGRLFTNSDGEDVGMDSASAIYSLKAFNITGGVVKVPKIWALTLGAQLWRWKMFVGTKADGSWNRPLNCINCGAGDTPTGFDPLAQPGFNPLSGSRIGDVDRNKIDTYITQIYGPNTATFQKSSFSGDYLSAGLNKGQLVGGYSDFVYFDYYNAYKNKIGEDKITDNLIGSTPNNTTILKTNYNWPQLWISPHHIPYVTPDVFYDKDETEGTAYIQLFKNNNQYFDKGCWLDYHTIMHNSRTGLPYVEGKTPTTNISDESLARSRKHDGNLGMVIQHLPDNVKDEFIYLFDTWCNNTWPDLLKVVDPVNFPNDPGSKLTSSYIFSEDISLQTLANHNAAQDEPGNVAIVLSDKNESLKKLYQGVEGQYWILNSTPKIWYGIDSTNDPNSHESNKFYDGFVVSDKIFKDYLGQFYDTFNQNRDKKIQEIQKKSTEEKTANGESTLDDDDIKLSLYRTFKSLTDKWISASDIGTSSTNCGNIPSTRLFFNIVDNGRGCSDGTGDKPTLAAHFQYVNRVMGDIGDKAVIDLTKLNDLKDNIKISLYQYLSDVLTDNEYMFFPLPSYINFTAAGMSKDDLEEMFKPVLSLDKVSSGPLFLSMYVGGNSRQLKYKGAANCPIDKLELDNISDDGFSISSQNDQGVAQINSLAPEEIKEPKLGDPNSSASFTSFNVVYGLDTQNHFKNIQLDQAEFSETAESLLVIDKLSKQGGTDQTTKGQNLNSVYLTRSYTCQVESLGNMMIQPMTYFDLIGVPMFQGAYLITEVRHSFKPNSSSTTFKGVRQSKATVPIVTDAAVAMNMSFKDMKTDGSGPSLNTVKQNTIPAGVDGTSNSLSNNQGGGQTIVGTLSNDTFVVNYKTGAQQPWLKKENGGLLPNQNGNRVLVPVKGYGAYTDMFHEAADAWMAMGEKMKLDTGVLIAKTGNGYRTADTQAKLRTTNGCPDLFSSSSTCRVQTAHLAKASDGTPYSSSNHGYGMANDTATFKGDAIFYNIKLPSGKGTYSTSAVCKQEAKDNGFNSCTDYALAQAKLNSSQYLSGGKLDLPKVREFYKSLPDKPTSAQLRTVNDLALLWMQENARDYGWYPLSSEPWHYEYQLQPDNGHPKFKSQFTGKIKNGDQYNLLRSTGYPDLSTLNNPIMQSPSALATTPTTPNGKVLGDSPSTAKDYILNKSEWKGTGLGAVMASITQKEGWIKDKGRAYKNNNPGNLRYSDSYKSIDPNVTNSDNFCKFSSDLLGLRALSDYVKTTSKQTAASGGAKKICTKNDAYTYNGTYYPSNALTRTNPCNGTSSGVPNPSIYEYFYVYAPPTDSNNPRNYAEGVVKNLNGMGIPATIDTPIEKVLSMKV